MFLFQPWCVRVKSDHWLCPTHLREVKTENRSDFLPKKKVFLKSAMTHEKMRCDFFSQVF